MEIGPQTKALVTGASAGIGLATAQALAARGATVGLVGRNGDTLAKAANPLGERGIPLVADITDRAGIEGAVEEFVSRAGDLESRVILTSSATMSAPVLS